MYFLLVARHPVSCLPRYSSGALPKRKPEIPPVNILHVESSMNWGGQEQRTVSEVRWLRSRGHRAWIACNPGSELVRRHPELCLAVKLRRSFDPAAATRLATLCRRHEIDLLHAHSPKDAWVCAALHLTVGPPVVRSRQITNPVKPTWSRSFVYRRGCAHVVAASRSIREGLVTRNAVAPERVSTVGEGVDLDVFHPANDGRSFRQEFGIDEHAVLFGIVAMIRGEKGHLDFIRAAQRVSRAHDRSRFVVVGEGTGDRAFEREVRALGAQVLPPDVLIFTGFRKDTPQVMAALDVLVVPSVAEAQSLVVPQAFATRRAVVASEVGGLPELVEHERTGLLVPPSQPEELARAMLRLAKDRDLRLRLAAAGYEVACERLAFGGKMQQTLEIYGQVTVAAVARRARRSVGGAVRRTGRVAGALAMVLFMWTASLTALRAPGRLELQAEQELAGRPEVQAMVVAAVPSAHFDDDDDDGNESDLGMFASDDEDDVDAV